MSERRTREYPTARVQIWFDSGRWDIESEPENDVNPIRGQSFLAWLRSELEALGYQVSGPDTEDWGWYLAVRCPGGHYQVGSIAWPSDKAGRADWMVQVWRHRSLRERLSGTGRMSRSDALMLALERIIREAAADSTETWLEEVDARGRPQPGSRPPS